MSQSINDVFTLPFAGDLEDLVGDDRNICVVGLFGKGDSQEKSKSLLFNQLLKSPVFKAQYVGQAPLSGEEDECYIEGYYDSSSRVLYLHLVSVFDSSMFSQLCKRTEQCLSEMCYIEGYYDSSSRVLYLHLVSVFDSSMFSQLCKRTEQCLSEMEGHLFWRDQEFDYARALIFMFTVCHILVLSHPKTTFDTSYVQLFRALENTREKQIASLAMEMTDLPISQEWQTAGRMCLPRLLFVFQKNDLTSGELNGMLVESKQIRGKKLSPIQVVQQNLEDQIFRIFRKSRVLTNNLNHCLFSVAANQAFVFIASGNEPTASPMDILTSSFREEIRTEDFDDGLLGPGIPANPNIQVFMDSIPTLTSTADDGSFKSFLQQHVDIILSGRGFEDSLVRGTAPAHFEFPSLRDWIKVADVLYELYMYPPEESKLYEEFENLQTVLDVDMRFSEGRCAKVLPIASRTYQDNASSHYTSIVHDNKFAQALKVYSQHARGPAYELFERKLEQECDAFWENGRQLCEVISLTGHHCILKLHLLPGEDHPTDPPLPEMPHTNNNRTPCACNCGKTIGHRDDPFELKVANYDFFQDLEEKCCSKLQHMAFPSYRARRPSESSARDVERQASVPGVEEAVKGATLDDHDPEQQTEKSKTVPDTQGDQPFFSPPLSLGQSANETILASSQARSMVTMDILSGSENIIPASKGMPRQLSAGFLQGMTCSASHPGLLPKYPSWSLVCHGKGNLYSHSKGLDQPNFQRDMNLLLPWDIPIPRGSKMDWPELEKTNNRRGGRNRKTQRDSFRAYIGLEYECPRGHRFIYSGTEKKTTGGGSPKDGGNRLVNSDMPLHVPCTCRNTKPPLGQLIRAYIITPEAPLYIQLNPRVRPGAHPCPVFFPEFGADEGITLTKNSFWVLRFPYVYVTEAEPIYPPTDNQPVIGAKVSKGLFLVTLNPPKT